MATLASIHVVAQPGPAAEAEGAARLQAAAGANLLWLAIVAVAFSLIGAFYYLRIVKVMFFDAPTDNAPLADGTGVRVLLSANGLALLVLGLMPGGLMAICLAAMKGSL
jgi:NADH-quinone oxidoreductase subunit N